MLANSTPHPVADIPMQPWEDEDYVMTAEEEAMWDAKDAAEADAEAKAIEDKRQAEIAALCGGAPLGRVDVFYRTFNKVFARRNVNEYEFQAPRGATLATLLALAKLYGIPGGDSLGGIFEMQTDDGIWSHAEQKNLRGARPSKCVFKTWEQMEQEEVR